MIGPQIPKELREQRRKKKEAELKKDAEVEKSVSPNSHESSSDDEIDGPQLQPQAPQTVSESKMGEEQPKMKAEMSDNTKAAKPTLLELHQKKIKDSGVSNKNRIHKFDHKQGLNEELKKEILRNVNSKGLDRFTKGSK